MLHYYKTETQSMILSTETFSFSFYEKSSTAGAGKSTSIFTFLANMRIQFFTVFLLYSSEWKRPFFEEHVCCLPRPFAKVFWPQESYRALG